LSRGYIHIAAPYHRHKFRIVLVHELTHNCLVHLPLPRWLNEGLAKTFDRSVDTIRNPILDHDLRERHLAFWNSNTIQEFWAGVSFHRPGTSRRLSYSLAEIVLNLLSEQKGDWIGFLKRAHRDDAGQTAAIECLGVDLGDVVATFLGEGDWRPRRRAMVDLWKPEPKNDDARDPKS